MATLPVYTARKGLSSDRIPNSARAPTTANSAIQLGNVGSAIESAGSTISDIGERLRAKNEQKENFRAENLYRRFEIDMQDQLDRAKQDMPEGGEGFYDAFMKDTFTPRREEFLQKIPERLRERFGTLLDPANGADFARWSTNVAGVEREATVLWAKDEVKSTQEVMANAISLDPDSYEQTLQAGRALIEQAPLPSLEKKMMLREWENMAQIAHLNRLMEDDPQAVLKLLGANPNKLAPTTQFEILSDAVQFQETGNNPNQISPAGAVGSHQVMPGTARWMVKEGIISDPDFNPNMDQAQVTEYLLQPGVSKRYGDTYLRYLQRRYPNDMEAVLIAYNGGPGRADKWIKNRDDSVLPAETRKYYKAIMSRLPGSTRPASGAADSAAFVWVRDGKNEALPQAERDKLNPDLLERVGFAFANVGESRIKIRSGHRDSERNKSAGGAKQSQHLEGNAVDIDVAGMPVARRLEIIRSLSAAGITGIGIYANAIHADLGARRAWGSSHHSDTIPKWARETVAAHMSGKLAPLGGATASTARRYATLPYDKRQQFINQADTQLAARMREANKVSAVAKVEMRQQIDNEIALITTTGKGSGTFDDTKLSTVLGEDDYLNFVERKDEAHRTFVAKDGMITMSPEELSDRIDDYKPNPASGNFDGEQKIHAAVVQEAERIIKMRTANPDKAALEFPTVRRAYDKVQEGIRNNQPDAGDVQTFVKLMIEQQQQFGVKPNAVAPIPHEWAFQIGQSLTRVPEMQKGNIAEVRAAIAVQYQALQQYFGDYTDEVILYALTQYQGLSKPVAEQVTALMQSVAVGGDPFKVRDRTDAAQVESAAEPWSFSDMALRAVGVAAVPALAPSLIYGAGDEEAGVDPTTAPDPETINRVLERLRENPEDEERLIGQYGRAAVDAAKLTLQ